MHSERETFLSLEPNSIKYSQFLVGSISLSEDIYLNENGKSQQGFFESLGHCHKSLRHTGCYSKSFATTEKKSGDDRTRCLKTPDIAMESSVNNSLG